MKTFLIIESNTVDQFIHEQILRFHGIEKLQIFQTLPKDWDFLKNITSPKTIVLLDMTTAMSEDWSTVKKPKEYLGELEVYVLYIMLTEADKNKLRSYDSIKGFIEKPFTLDKLKEILED